MGELTHLIALNSNHVDCAVLLHDADGNQLCSTTVVSHDRGAMRIEVRDMPDTLKIGAGCSMLVLTSPAPCEYQGRIASEGNRKIIALYRGRERENRGSARFNVNSQAVIENMIYDNKASPLHTPLIIDLINISKSGFRFRSPNYTMSDGDRFQMRMKIHDSEKLLIADVVHHIDKDAGKTEYGCRFLIGSEKAV